jgi:uncharacterized membrane protein (UPF0127 family)
MAGRPSMRTVAAVLVVAMVSVAAVYLYASTTRSPFTGQVPSRFTVGGRTFPITYTATDQSEWQTGLMNRRIKNTTTMLFIFPTSDYYPFWMFDTNASLDIIWMDARNSSGTVVYVATDLPSCFQPVGCPQYTPNAAANYVLEAKAGFAVANGVAVGTVISFD